MRKALLWLADGLLFAMSVPLAQSISFRRSLDLEAIAMDSLALLIVVSPFVAIIALARGWWLIRTSEPRTAYVRALPYFAVTAVMGCFLLTFLYMFHLTRDLLAAMAVHVALVLLLTFVSPLRFGKQIPKAV